MLDLEAHLSAIAPLWFVVMDCVRKAERFWCSCREGHWVQRGMKYVACHTGLRNKDVEGLQEGVAFVYLCVVLGGSDG